MVGSDTHGPSIAGPHRPPNPVCVCRSVCGGGGRGAAEELGDWGVGGEL